LHENEATKALIGNNMASSVSQSRSVSLSENDIPGASLLGRNPEELKNEVTGAKWCDFIVYTKVGLYVQRITLDVQFWERLKEKLFAYYFEHFIKFAF
jgi:hypothetical protein